MSRIATTCCLSALPTVLLLSLATPASGSRVSVDLAENLTGTVSQLVSQFQINVKNTLCLAPNLDAFEGILKKYPKTVKAVQTAGREWANNYNCRICHVSAQHGSMDSPKVDCAAETGHITSGNIAEACFSSNGKVGWQSGNNVCLPCPKECEYCEKPGTLDVSYLSSRWFKCVLPSESGNTPVSQPWTCEPIADRKGRGQRQWCRYRYDLADTASGETEPSSSGTWDLRITAAPCNAQLEDAQVRGVAGIMQSVKSALDKQWQRNCALCRITAGGPLSKLPAEEFKAGTSSSRPWADSVCANDELGSTACRRDRGQTGWNNELGCNPCPIECVSCTDSTSSWLFSGKGFSCKLAPSVPAKAQLGLLLTPEGPADVEESSPPKTPEGYDCEKPKKRACTSGDGLCMGYKTRCKYREWAD